MDSNQTWYEASLVCVHSFLWIWASSETSKITPLLCLYLVKCFQLKVNFLLHITSMNVHGFHPNSNRVTSTMCSSYPVKMSKIWGFKKYHLLSVCFSAKKCIFGSFITSMNVHGFHPNSNRVTPTMCPSYPVKMSKIWGFKNITYFGVFTEKLLRSVTFWVTYKFHECPWISTKFGMKHSHCTLIYPCEYGAKSEDSKISPLYLVIFFVWKFY